MKRALAIASLSSIAAGCSGGGGGGGGDATGGYVRVEHNRSAAGAEATFARAELGKIDRNLPEKGCGFPDEPETGAGEWLDVGESIILDGGGGATIELTRATLGTRIVYGADGLPADDSPAGASFDVSLAGTGEIEARTWEDAIAIPQPAELGELLNQIGFLIEQVIEWTPSPDADELILEIGSAGHVDFACRVSGSKSSVTLSDDENSQLESSGGTITLRAIRREHRTLEGRRVALEGHSVVVIAYE